MISIEQADKIKELVALIRKADEERVNFALSGIEELEAKVDNAVEALDMFLDEIIDHNTRV
ncbi:molybdopterin-guanine dinucleotide biosynthesis protein MobD [Shigella sonnei]